MPTINRYRFFALVPFLLIFPFIHYTPVPGLPGFLPLSTVLVFFIVACMVVGNLLRTGLRFKKINKVDMLLLTFVVIHLFVLPFSVETKVSLRVTLELILSYSLYYLISKSKYLTINWVKGLPYAVVFVSLLALGQFITDSDWPMSSFMNDTTNMERLTFGDAVPAKAVGAFLHGNSLAIFLTLTLPVILGLALTFKNRRKRIALLAVFVAGTMAQVCSLSRGGFLSLSFGLLVIWFLSRKRASFLKQIFAAAKYVLPALLLIVLIGYSIGATDMIKERFFSADFSSRDAASNFSRVINLMAGIKAVEAHPLVGIGAGTSGKYYVDYGGWTGLGPHNLYLFIASERGIPALIVFIWAVCAALWVSTTRFKNKGYWLACGLISAIIAGLANGLFESILTDVFLPFFFANLGCLMFLASNYGSNQDNYENFVCFNFFR